MELKCAVRIVDSKILLGVCAFVISAVLATFSQIAFATGKKCLHISSYSLNYEWTAGVDAAVWKKLNGHCAESKTFTLDGKVRPEQVSQKALEAKALIDNMNPDVVIVSDDLAVQYVLQAFYKDSKIPFVFCGLNWSASEYGLPYSNATGMIEINAIDVAVTELMHLLPSAKNGICIAEPSETGKKICSRFAQILGKFSVSIKQSFPTTYALWEKDFLSSQQLGNDFVLLPLVHGVKNFDFEKAKLLVESRTRKISVSVYKWMVPYSILSFVTTPAEQGEYAGAVAAKILTGSKPLDFPIVTNRKWELLVNNKLAGVAGVNLPPSLLKKANLVKEK